MPTDGYLATETALRTIIYEKSGNCCDKMMLKAAFDAARTRHLGFSGELKRGVNRFVYEKIMVDVDSERVGFLYQVALGRIASDRKNFEDACSAMGVKPDEKMMQMAELRSVARTVYDSSKYVKMLNNKRSWLNPDPLDRYIINGGNCVSISLTTIAVLQRLREDGYISGRFGIKYNFPKTAGQQLLLEGNQRPMEIEGHAWLIYKGKGGRMIVDSTAAGRVVGYAGRKEREAARQKADKEGTWNYYRNEMAISIEDKLNFVGLSIMTFGNTVLAYNNLLYIPFAAMAFAGALTKALQWLRETALVKQHI